jgi:hypothetical protein
MGLDRMDEKKPKRLRIFVRRGALRRFDRLKRDSGELPVAVTWDRRQEERRAEPATTSGERRKTDRRKAPPFTWDAADFVVADTPPPEDE